MTRIALGNLEYPASPPDSVAAVTGAIARAAEQGAGILCFPECFVPGYRGLGHAPPPPDPAFLDHAWSVIADAAAQFRVAVVLGTERIVAGALSATALVIGADGTRSGFQDKVQVDPSEDGIYSPGEDRHIFHAGEVTFGVVICHEGWRYPETVRWAPVRGAQIVFHPHYHPPEPDGFRPVSFAHPANSFHEKAVLCRAAENTCFFATVNYACPGSPTTSAVINPDGTLLCHHPYGVSGLLVADLDLTLATGLLARRFKPCQ